MVPTSGNWNYEMLLHDIYILINVYILICDNVYFAHELINILETTEEFLALYMGTI